MVSTTRRVILDVDVGCDDFLAILIFLHAEKLGQCKIEAIVCTKGNTTTDNVTANVIKILEVARRTDIPVFKGAKDELIPIKHNFKPFNGLNGLGDIVFDPPPNLTIVSNTPAAVAIADLIRKNPKEISLICLAPLTNIALAIKLYPDFAENVKDVWIMGGNHTAVGNTTEAAEQNFYIDPEAAFIVLNSFTCPIYLLTWESALNADIDFKWRHEVFGKTDNDLILLLNKIEKIIYADWSEWYPCDGIVAGAYLREDIILKKAEHWATVELHGSLTRGQVVLDHLKQKKPNVVVIEEVNLELFKEMLLSLK